LASTRLPTKILTSKIAIEPVASQLKKAKTEIASAPDLKSKILRLNQLEADAKQNAQGLKLQLESARNQFFERKENQDKTYNQDPQKLGVFTAWLALSETLKTLTENFNGPQDCAPTREVLIAKARWNNDTMSDQEFPDEAKDALDILAMLCNDPGMAYRPAGR
jgi:hypothetical protein